MKSLFTESAILIGIVWGIFAEKLISLHIGIGLLDSLQQLILLPPEIPSLILRVATYSFINYEVNFLHVYNINVLNLILVLVTSYPSTVGSIISALLTIGVATIITAFIQSKLR